MRTLTKTGIRMLSAKYRSILIKCAIINASVFVGVFGAGSAMAAQATLWNKLANFVADETQNPINLPGDITRSADDTEEITVARAVTINGDNYTLSGDDTYQGLTVDTDGNLTLNNITMQNFTKATSDMMGQANGGAVNNKGTITDITGNFDSNFIKSSGQMSYANGGAIYNNGTISNIKGNFVSNSADSGFPMAFANGGAIYNETAGTIENIEGDFISNHSGNSGGAIYNNGTISNIKGDFTSNYSSDGGAIRNSWTIENIEGDFIANHATGTGGGGIHNFNGNIKSITGNFIGNYTKKNEGGAIYNYGTNAKLNIVADNGELKFDGNYLTSSSNNGGAIYNSEGSVGLYAVNKTDKITFTGSNEQIPDADKASAKAIDDIYNIGTLNINGFKDTSGAITKYVGTVNLYTVSDAATAKGTTKIYGGTVNVAKDITQKAITIADGAILTTKGNVTTTDGITNAGTLNLTGTSAVINSVINGENGITNFGDNQHNASIEVQQAISQAINIQNGAWVVANADIGLTGKAFNIEENAALDIAADNIKADIVNKSLELIINDGIDHTSGIISTKITGDGATTLAGKDFFIAENGLIDQDLHLSGTLTTNADKLGDGHQIFRSYGDFPAIVNLTGGILKGSIIGPKTTITDGSSVGIANDYYIGNLVLGNNSTLNQKNNSTGVLNIGILGLTSNNNLMLDADLAGEKMDQLSVMEISGSNTLKISDIQLLSDADDDYVELSLFADGTTTDVYNKVSGNLNGLKYSSIYKYDALYDSATGKIGFTRYNSGTSDDFNPYIYAPSGVANTTVAMTTQIATLAMDKMDDVVHIQGRSGGDTPTSSNVWVKVMGLNDNVEFNNFENIDSKSLTVAAGYNTNKITCGDCDIVLGAYAGYIGGKQQYTDNDIDQNGGYIGLSSALTLGNAFATATVNGGLLNNKANNMYGTDRFNTRWLGAGLKTGYNYAITNSVILQPNLYGGYTLVNTQDYTSVSGVKIATNNLNFFEIDPGLKLSAVIADGWTTSVQGKYVIVMDNGGDITANDIALINISPKNYFEYGIGIDKSLTDAFYLGAKINRHDGGRTGWNGSIEFRYKF